MAHGCVCFVSKKIAESDQTVTLGGVSLFFNKWRISDMGLQTISTLIANLSCHQQYGKQFVARSRIIQNTLFTVNCKLLFPY